MSSVQERLQLKRVPLDNWSIREQLCLASAVVRSGDQNWMSVSRSLKSIGEPNRPADWYSQKSCAAQYGVLLENVETPKRKKRNSDSAGETPQENILKKLTQERIVEIQKTLAEMNQQYDQMKNDLNEIRNAATTEERLKEMWASVEASKRARERETAKRAAWLKEREERRARAEKTWRPNSSPTGATAGSETPTICSPSPAPPPPSSPLLTSLLKSSPVVTTPQHISHPANVVDTVSPSAGAPTLSMLLEQPGNRTADNKHAAIEHIKSQLVQIEKRLKARTNSAAAPLDIDDIEIKAEDVYAFRDVDIHIPPVAALHKGAPRPPDKPEENKDGGDEASVAMDVTSSEEIKDTEVKDETVSLETTHEEITEVETVTEETAVQEQPPEPEATPEPEIKVSFPEVKFPNLEIKIIHPEDQKVKEELKEPEVPPPAPEVPETQPEVGVEEQPMEVEESAPIEETPQAIESQPEVEPPVEHPEPEMKMEDIKPEDIPLPPDMSVQEEEVVESEDPPPLPEEPEKATEPESVQPEEDKKEPPQPEVAVEEPEASTPEPQETEVEEQAEDELKKDEDTQDSLPVKEMVLEELQSVKETEREAKHEKRDDEPHTETDDDAPMEVRYLSREEEKDGKKKRDYSRKKKSDSRTCSGSESATEQSAPESPATDSEKLHRLWKKSVMLVYSRLCAHKYASLFARPITDEEAPRYSRVVRRPMDLSTIRKHIDNGTLRTTAEFQRDILLMLTNALMYNNTQHSVYQMAKEMFDEAKNQLGMLLAAQAHAGLCQPPPTRKRTRNEMSR